MIRGVFVLVVALGVGLLGCSRGSNSDASGDGSAVVGSAEAVERVRTAVRALASPDASVDYVAAQMEGVIKGRTSSQALIHYDGYRVTFTTPGERVTRIQFDFAEAKPTMAQLTDAFGLPEEVGRGWLYRQRIRATNTSIRVFAEPATPPASDTSLVRRPLLDAHPLPPRRGRKDSLVVVELELSNGSDDRPVRRGELVVVEVGRRHPGVVGDLEVLHLPRRERASVEEEQHLLPWVSVMGHLQDALDSDLDPDLLTALANDRRLRRLPGLDLAAGKLPEARQMLIVSSPREQDAPAFDHDGGGNDNHARRIRCWRL